MFILVSVFVLYALAVRESAVMSSAKSRPSIFFHNTQSCVCQSVVVDLHNPDHAVSVSLQLMIKADSFN